MGYDKPTQVLFTVDFEEGDEENALAGIAYGNEVICACCGSVFELDEVTIIEEMRWVDFTEFVR